MAETLTVPVGDRLVEVADEWADARMMDEENALEQKVEQALLEVEHLASEANEVEFSVEDGEIHYVPSDELLELLESQADRVDSEPGDVLGLHLELFARTFLPSDTVTPDGVPDMGGADGMGGPAGMGGPGAPIDDDNI